MATAAKTSQQDSLQDVLNVVAQRKISTTTAAKTEVATEAEFKNIEANTFKQIVASNLSRQEKLETFEKELLKIDTKENARKVMAELNEFKAYMQHEWRHWSMESLELASTEVLSQMKGVYKDMNDGMNNINNELMPQVEMLQGLSDLRLSGKTEAAYLEVQREQEENKRREVVLAAQKERGEKLIADKEIAERALAVAKTKTRMLIGGYSKETKAEIANLELDIQKLDEQNAALADEIVRTREEFSKPLSSELGDDPKILKAKQQLADLMGTPDDELDAKQERLKTAVMTYINSIDAKTKQARVTLDKQAEQCVMSLDQATAMRGVYALINDATKGATAKSQERFAKVESDMATADSESAKIELEDKRDILNEHINTLTETGRETLDSLAELTQSRLRVSAMQDSNRAEIQQINTLHTSGNASMAERLLTVFNGVNQAASHESSAMVKNSMSSMRGSTTDLLNRGVLGNAIGLGEENEARLKQIMELADSSKVLQAAAEITAKNLALAQQRNQETEEQANKLKQDIENLQSLSARMAAPGTKSSNDNAAVSTQPAAKVENRFNKPAAGSTPAP